MSDREIPLPGGDVTEGVVRVGDTVRRPLGPHSPLVHAVLVHLESVGVSGAPRFIGVDGQGRETLTYVEGEVAGRPWPAWVADERRIASVARLVRRLDDAMESFGVPAALVPPSDEGPEEDGRPPRVPLPRTMIGHRDVTPENVVFRDGSACALIDFDLARPTHPVEEVFNVLLWWAPLMPVDDREPVLREVDPLRRARVLVDAYGLDDRSLLVDVAIAQTERSWFAMRQRAVDLGGGWQRMWDDGVGDRIRRRAVWLRDRADDLREVLA